VLVAHAAADLVLLVKPQFEAAREEASRGRGVIRDPAVRDRVVEEVVGAFGRAGATMMGVMASPVIGAEGNVELLAHLRVDGSGVA
jgi:23S rRNA (cytidine1920-2'-O)/16S rRNA (cytidine1409-2'-O)-methyltransferase